MQVFVNVMGKEMRRHPVKSVHPDMLSSITIKLDDGQEFTVKDGGNGLRIYATNGRLVIEPEASNVIQVSELRE